MEIDLEQKPSTSNQQNRQASGDVVCGATGIIEGIIASQIQALRAMSPPIEAVGVGGSVGKRSFDRYSDIDFFVLYPSHTFFQHLREFPARISHELPEVTHGGAGFVPGFGFAYSYILRGGIALDYNLNCRETLNSNPMRAHTQVIFDNTGFLSKFTKFARRGGLADQRLSAQEAVHDYLGRLLKIRKSAYRSDLIVLMYNLDKLRLVMLGIDRAVSLNSPYSAFHADHSIASVMGDDYGRSTLATFPYVTRASLEKSLRTICARIRAGVAKLDCRVSKLAEVWHLEKSILSQTRAHIKHMQWL